MGSEESIAISYSTQKPMLLRGMWHKNQIIYNNSDKDGIRSGRNRNQFFSVFQ